jgi:hypothetical protein
MEIVNFCSRLDPLAKEAQYKLEINLHLQTVKT